MPSLRNPMYPKSPIQKRARKVMVEYDGSNFNVVSDKKVEMAPPPSDAIEGYQDQTGFWYSVADRNGRVLYRRVLGESLFSGIEVFARGATEKLYRLDKPLSKVTLVLVFPDLPVGVRLDVFGSARNFEGHLLPASPLTTIPLNETGRKGGDRER